MSSTATPDETPKQAVAKKVVTQKRLYFLPDQGVSVKAASLDEAIKAATKINDVKAGDE